MATFFLKFCKFSGNFEEKNVQFYIHFLNCVSILSLFFMELSELYIPDITQFLHKVVPLIYGTNFKSCNPLFYKAFSATFFSTFALFCGNFAQNS